MVPDVGPCTRGPLGSSYSLPRRDETGIQASAVTERGTGEQDRNVSKK